MWLCVAIPGFDLWGRALPAAGVLVVVYLVSILPHVVYMMLVLTAMSSPHALAGEKECSSLQGLWRLEGNWLELKQGKISAEIWQRASHATLEGSSRVMKDGRLTHYETIRLVEMSSEIFYLVKVDQNPLPIAFKLVHCEDDRFYFENRKHDFPKRIDYIFSDDGSLQVDVSDGSGRGFGIHYKKQ